MGWQQILFIIGAGLMVYWGWHLYKRGALRFSRENTTKSLGTLGLLALFLIAVILLAIKYLRGG